MKLPRGNTNLLTIPGLAVEVALNVVLEDDLCELLPPVVGLKVAKHEQAPEGKPRAVRPAIDTGARGEGLRERLAVAGD